MILRNVENRLQRLETVRPPFHPENIRNMSNAQLRHCLTETLDHLGGPHAALSTMRDAGADAETIEVIANWPIWFEENLPEASP